MNTDVHVPLRVLVVEDSEDDCALLLRELRRGGYAPLHERIDTPEALEAALDRQQWDIVFGDYTMPQFSGTQALARVRARGLDTPFIFVSGTIGEDTAVSAMRAGAQDYVMKGSLKRLLPAVARELREVRLRRERERAEAERRTAEARFRHILTIAADAVIAVDEDQRITVFNHGAEQIFGYRAAEVEGQLLDVLLPPRFLKSHSQSVRAFADVPDTARRMNERGEVYGRRKDGSEFPAEASIAKLHEDGRTTFTVILRDITERKRGEQELRLLQTITVAAGEAGDVHTALAVTLEKVCETARWSLAQAWIPRGDGAALEPSSAWHCREHGMETFRSASLALVFSPGEGLPGRVWTSRRPLWLRDVTQDGAFSRAASAAATGIKSALAIPVLAGEQAVAVLEFFVREPREEDGRMVELVSAVAAQLGTIIQRKHAEERLHYLAHYDPLTGLPNRLLFQDRLERAMIEAERRERLVGVAFLDLDRFKTINDSLGHGVGDQLLKAVAERLGRCVRASDTVARHSGDEFALILADMRHVDDAAGVAQKILDAFAQPFRVDGRELFSSASLGFTLYPFDDRSADALLRNADIAMFRAKEAGGNGYEFYAAEMTSKAHERLALENDLRRALERNELLVHYQPVVEIGSGRIIGVEALVRWRHPERGMIPPAEFIPLAEETGLIARIGERVLRLACEEWQACRVFERPLRVAVNVSIRQFQQPELPERVVAILRGAKFDPAALELEITESVLMQSADATLVAMHKLNALGVRLAIDDFGTGYSSLSYLKRLPIGALKVDQSFVRDVPGDPNDAAIVTAIISMAHKLGLHVVAEGVETREQFEFLRAEGCDYAQGYYFSPPLPAEEIQRLLAAGGTMPRES